MLPRSIQVLDEEELMSLNEFNKLEKKLAAKAGREPESVSPASLNIIARTERMQADRMLRTVTLRIRRMSQYMSQ